MALGIVLQSPNLMMRPMLLSYVDDLVNVNKIMKYGFQIYETLIDQWLDRESSKAGILKKYGKQYKGLLYQFSKSLARDLYLNRSKRNGKLSLNANEIIDNPNGLQLRDIEGNSIEMDKYDQTSRTLLNRNAIGEYKFSHKSILEYFLALEVFNYSGFRKDFFFDADLDAAKKFFLEMIQYEKDTEDINHKKYDLSKLGFSESDIKFFSSKKFMLKSLDDILKVLWKTTLGDSFKHSMMASGIVLIIANFISLIITPKLKITKNLDNIFPVFAIITLISSGIIMIIYYRRYLKIREELKDKREIIEKIIKNH